jgi:hypothetical protein
VSDGKRGEEFIRSRLQGRFIIKDTQRSRFYGGTMNTLAQVLEIASRLDHLATNAEWIARETVHTDNSVSQTGTLISVLCEDIREKITALVSELEQIAEVDSSH